METCEQLAPAIIEKLYATEFPAKTLVNVNFPNCSPDEVEGPVSTRQGAFTHGLFMEKRYDGRGFPYYWLRFGRDVPNQKNGSDIIALQKNRISVTPLKLDLTDTVFKEELDRLF